MNLAPRTVLCVLTEDLGLQAYKRYTWRLLNVCLKIAKLIFCLTTYSRVIEVQNTDSIYGWTDTYDIPIFLYFDNVIFSPIFYMIACCYRR